MDANRISSIESQIKLLLSKLTDLIEKHPYLIHSWRFAVGAVHALNESYKNHIERNSYTKPDIYSTQVQKVISQILGKQPPNQIWLAGFHFNDALMRIAAFYERSLRSLISESIHNEKITVSRKNKPKNIKIEYANVIDLASIVQNRLFNSNPIKITVSEKVRKEVNKLKHQVCGALPQDAVTIDEAIKALMEIMDLLCYPQSEKELTRLYKTTVPPA